MKRMISILIAGMVLCTAGAAAAADYIIIVNKANTVSALSLGEVQNMFDGNIELWKGGGKIKSAYPNTPAGGCDIFYTKLLGTTADKFKKDWMKKVFAGYGAAPVACAGAAEVAKYVSETSGGIGMIPASEAATAGSCKIVSVSE